MKKIASKEEFEQLLENHMFLLLKHSLTCPISGAAFDEYSKFVNEQPAIETAYLAVQEAKPLSEYVRDTTGIKHESPQAILFKNREAVWNTSHGRITAENLEQAFKEFA